MPPQRLHRGARRRAESLLALARAGGARAPVIALAALDDDEAASVFARGPELFSSTVDLDEHVFELPRDATVCVVEPARISRAQRRDWACRLADYEIIQVFDQLSPGLVAA